MGTVPTGKPVCGQLGEAGISLGLTTAGADAIPLEREDEKYRARQDVVFEHGYPIGKLCRDHVCALVKGNVETPGDISGVVYVSMDSAGAWKMQLGKNMKAVGLPVDLNTFCG